MGVTPQKPSVLAEEFVAHEIERCRHVPAPIDVGVEVSSIIDQESIQPIPLANQPEFLYGSRSEIADFGDHAPAIPAFGLHRALVAQKKPTMDRQPDEIEREKRQ